jgi:hypothetical protein
MEQKKKRKPFDLDSTVNDIENKKKKSIIIPNSINYGEQKKIEDEKSENLTRLRSMFLLLAAEIDKEKKKKAGIVSNSNNYN